MFYVFCTYVFFFFSLLLGSYNETETPLGKWKSYIIPQRVYYVYCILTGNDTYLVFGSVQLLSRVGLTGSDLHVLVHQPNTAVLGVDFDYR